MEYTQLDFAPYSSGRRALSKQAEFPLQELVAGRAHAFPCDCGACIYWAYRRTRKNEGRSFSKRTFFVHFLRRDLLTAALVESLPLDYARFKRAARVQRLDAISDHGAVRQPPILFTDFYADFLRKGARKKVLSMIRELERTKQNLAAREFLRGILNRRCFYTYYKRADEEAVYSIVKKAREDLSSMQDREPMV